MKPVVYRILLTLAAVCVVCGVYVATSRASCGPNCNHIADGFVKITSCFGVHNTTGCVDYGPTHWCQNDTCIYVAGIPRNPHNVTGLGTMCITDALLCSNGGPHACSDKNGPN